MTSEYTPLSVKKIEIRPTQADEHAARNLLRAGLALHAQAA
jgi:hypothetical protein